MRIAGPSRTVGRIDLPVRNQLIFHRDFAFTLFGQILGYRNVQTLHQVTPEAYATGPDNNVLLPDSEFIEPQCLGHRLTDLLCGIALSDSKGLLLKVKFLSLS